jgi:hypothetical protein
LGQGQGIRKSFWTANTRNVERVQMKIDLTHGLRRRGTTCNMTCDTTCCSQLALKCLSCCCCVSSVVGFFLFFYSCCSHLKHRASVKRFVSLQFLNLRQSVGLLGRGISPSQGRYLTQTDIHALSEIRTHDPYVRAGRNISCFRPRGHCDSTV